MDESKALLIQQRDLSRVVERAVKLAEERLGGPVADDRFVRKWEILGRILRERDLLVAEKFANEVARNLGPAAQPALVKIDDRILAGFIERIDVPQFEF